MTQLIINIEDKSMLPHLKKILGALNGVSIAKPVKNGRTGFEEAMEDIREGRVYKAASVKDMFSQILG